MPQAPPTEELNEYEHGYCTVNIFGENMKIKYVPKITALYSTH
jgi:hypothetical protein